MQNPVLIYSIVYYVCCVLCSCRLTGFRIHFLAFSVFFFLAVPIYILQFLMELSGLAPGDSSSKFAAICNKRCSGAFSSVCVCLSASILFSLCSTQYRKPMMRKYRESMSDLVRHYSGTKKSLLLYKQEYLAHRIVNLHALYGILFKIHGHFT